MINGNLNCDIKNCLLLKNCELIDDFYKLFTRNAMLTFTDGQCNFCEQELFCVCAKNKWTIFIKDFSPFLCTTSYQKCFLLKVVNILVITVQKNRSVLYDKSLLYFALVLVKHKCICRYLYQICNLIQSLYLFH